MPFRPGEPGGKEVSQQFGGQLFPNDSRAKAEHIHVVVFHALPGGE